MPKQVEIADGYYGGLVGVEYAGIFRCRSPILIKNIEALVKVRFG